MAEPTGIRTAMRCRLDRPALAAAAAAAPVDGWWTLEVDLDERQADGLTCLRCGGQDGAMVPVGWVERPDGTVCALFAHGECEERLP